MESTGQRGFVQVSESTANLLIEAGKGHWLTPREDLVAVKGKGHMRTFFLESREAFSQRTATESEAPEVFSCDSTAAGLSAENDGDGAPEDISEGAFPPGRGMLRPQDGEIWGNSEVFDTMPPPLMRSRSSDPLSRLIDWNVQVLIDLLKKVVAQRMSLQSSKSNHGESSCFTLPITGGCAIEEIAEIIELPSFDPSAAACQVHPESVEIDNEVEDELRAYVTNIARLYRDNPFHNYEVCRRFRLAFVSENSTNEVLMCCFPFFRTRSSTLAMCNCLC